MSTSRVVKTAVVVFFLATMVGNAQRYTWRFVDSLRTPRLFFSALSIGNNKILVMGGMTQSSISAVTDSCEIITVDSGKVRPAARMPIARGEFPALLTGDGKVVAIGGIYQANYNSGPVTGQVDMYDPVTNTWRTVGNLLVARRQHTAIFIDSIRILVTGGRRADLSSIIDCEVFNIRTGTSARVADYPFPNNGPTAEYSMNGNLLVFTGREGGPGSWRDTSAIRYDPATNTFARVSRLPEQIYHPTITKLWSGRTLMVGGSLYEGSPFVLSSAVNKETTNMSYTNVASLPQGLFWHQCLQMNTDSVIVISGSINSFSATNQCSWFNLNSNAVTTGPPVNRPRMFYTAVSTPIEFSGGVPTKAKIFAISGVTAASGGTMLRSVEVLEQLSCDNNGILVSAGPDTTEVCEGTDSVRLRVTATRGTLPAVVDWTPSVGLRCPTCPETMARILSPVRTYIVTAVDSNGCIGRDTIVVRMRSFGVSAGNDTSVCAARDSAMLRAVGLNRRIRQVQWTPSVGLACDTCQSTKARPSVTTDYVLTATDSLGCVGRDTVRVYVSSLTVSAGVDQTLCSPRDSAYLRVVSASSLKSIKWTPSSGVRCDTCLMTRARPQKTTTYVVRAETEGGCVAFDTIVVRLGTNAAGVKKGPDQFICFANDSAMIGVLGKVASIVWTPDAGLRCTTCPSTWAKPEKTTTYSYVAVDSAGCVASDSVTVTILPKSTVDATPDVEICTSTATLLSAFGSFQSVEWSPPAGLSCVNCGSTLAVPQQKSMTYYVRARNGNSADCESRDSVRIRYAPGIENQIPPKVEICAGDSVSLNIRFGGSVRWTPSLNLNCDTCKSVIVRPAKSQRYVVTGDSLGCLSRDTIDIVVQTTTLSVPVDTVVCKGSSLTLSAGTNSSVVRWTPTTGLSCSTCATVVASPVQTTTYVVRAGTGSCMKTDSFTVRVLPLPVVTCTPSDTVLCEGGSFPARVAIQQGSAFVTWASDPDLSCLQCDNPVITPRRTSTYKATVRSAQGCDTTVVVRVSVVTKPVITLSVRDTSVCPGSVVQCTVRTDNNTSVVWSPLRGLTCDTCSMQVIAADSTTTYVVRSGVAGTGCETIDSIRVRVFPAVNLVLSGDTTICMNAPVRLRASGAVSYRWQPANGLSCVDCPEPTASPAQTTTYTVRAQSTDGCVATGSIRVVLRNCDAKPEVIAGIPARFSACDSTFAEFSVLAKGTSSLLLDSISVALSTELRTDARNTARINASLPTSIRPLLDTFRFRLPFRAVAAVNGQVTVTLYCRDTLLIVTVPVTAYRDVVEFKLPDEPLSLQADSVVALPVRMFGPSGSGVGIRDSLLVRLNYEAGSLYYEDSVRTGTGLNADWSIRHDPLRSSASSDMFVLYGTSTLQNDGELFVPYYRSLLSRQQRNRCTLDVQVPSVAACIQPSVTGVDMLFSACIISLRQIVFGGVPGGLVSVYPHPVRDADVAVEYGVDIDDRVQVLLYDTQGRHIATLIDADQKAGEYRLHIPRGTLPSGVFYCVMHHRGRSWTKTVTVLR